MGKLEEYIKNPFRLYWKLEKYMSFDWMSDEAFIRMKYHAAMGKKLNLKNPRTFQEKLQWLKLYDRNPLYTTLVDKQAVKEYVAVKIGDAYVIPTLGVWDSFDDIDFDVLPNQFVLKCTHDSGGLVIVTDKAEFDREAAKEKIETSLATDFYKVGREWPYKNVPHRIIAEQYMIDDDLGELKDYKFYCFNGEPKYLFIASDRNKGGQEVKFDYFDINFNRLQLKNAAHPNSTYDIKQPETFHEMIKIAAELSSGIPQVRIDLYEVNGHVYFGEYTFFSGGGWKPFDPEEYAYIWGEQIILPSSAKRK